MASCDDDQCYCLNLGFADEDHVIGARIISLINMVFLLAAGLFVTIWPLMRAHEVDFPATCSKGPFVVSTLVGYGHLVYALFLLLWVIFFSREYYPY